MSTEKCKLYERMRKVLMETFAKDTAFTMKQTLQIFLVTVTI